jgi:Mn2+/Fe2+ NRAMP family transporter
VMQTDVLLTLVLLTCATIPFYMLGAGVLYRLNVQPDGLETITVLSNTYTQTLGEWAFWLFTVGAFAVLYSTCVSGLGGGVRSFADGMVVMGLIERNDYDARVRILKIWAVVSPLVTSGDLGGILLLPEPGFDAADGASVRGDQIPNNRGGNDLPAI